MKPKFLLPAAGLSLFLVATAPAASLTWDAAVDMNWDLSTTNWSGSIWNNTTPDSALFGTAGAGAVSLATGITAGSVTFNAVGYTIQNNTLTLKAASAGATTITANESATVNSAIALNNNNQAFSAASGKTLTLGGVMSGSNTLTYGGSGSYVIAGVNTNSGNLTIDTATVTVNSGATLFGATLGWSGRTVTIQNGGVLVADNFANGAGNLWGQIGDGTNNVTIQSGGVFKMTGATMDSTVNKGFDVVAANTGYFRVATGTSTIWNGRYTSRDFNVNTGGTLVFDGGGSFETSRYIRGAGSVTKNDGGTLKLTDVNGFTGTLTVNGGILDAAKTTTSGSSSSLGGGSNTIVVNSGGTLKITGGRGAGYHSGTVTINGGTITMDGSDLSFASGKTLTFDTAAGTINGGASGQWRRRDGSNKIAVTAAASGSVISVAELNLYDSNPVIDVADGLQDADLTISSIITSGTGTGNLVKSGGSGKLVLTGNSTGFTGSTTVNAGTLQIGGGGTSGSIAGNITNNAALVFDRSDSLSAGNAIGGTGTLTKNGSGTLTLTNTNSYSGGTTVTNGTLAAGSAGAFGSGAVNVTGGSLNLAGYNVTNNITVGASGKLIGASGQILANVTFVSGAAMTGSFGSFNSGANPAKVFNVAGGASYTDLSGQGTFTGGSVTVGGNYAPGNSPGSQTFDSGLTLNGATVLEIGGDGSADLINVTGGTLTLGNLSTLTLQDYNADYTSAFWDIDQVFTLISSANTVSGSFNSITNNLGGVGQGTWTTGWVGNNYQASWTAVPEPGAALLGGFGLLALLRRRR